MGMIGLAIGQLMLGPISDRYGRKPALIISMLVFIAGAEISVFSTSMTFFLMCRLIQGMGASGGYFLARTIPADIFHGRELANSRNRFILRTGRNCLGTGLSPDIWSCCATRLS